MNQTPISIDTFRQLQDFQQYDEIYLLLVAQYEFLLGLSNALTKLGNDPMLKSMLPMLAKTLPTL